MAQPGFSQQPPRQLSASRRHANAQPIWLGAWTSACYCLIAANTVHSTLMKPRLFQIVIACTLTLFGRFASGQEFRLQPAFFGRGDGSLQPGDRPYLTGDGNRLQRGMAFNPVTAHLLVVNRSPAGVHIVDGNDGADLGALDLSALSPGGNPNFPVNLVGVAEDGAIYVGNLSNAQFPPEYRLYRSANETALQTLVFAGDPSNGNTNAINQRWGDTLAVRGTGPNTQVLIASRGTLVAILRPTDETMTAFTSTPLETGLAAGSLGWGLTFGPTNTFYGTAGAQSGGPLHRLQFDLAAGAAQTVNSYNAQTFPGTITPIGLDTNHNLLAGVAMVAGADLVRLYNIADPANGPVFLDRKPFFSTNANPIFAGAIAFANGRLYALDSDNGIMAFDLVFSSDPVEPAIFNQPLSRSVMPGTNVTFRVSADGTPPLTYQWRIDGIEIANATNDTFAIADVQPSDAGNYSVEVGNAAGSLVSSDAVLTVLTNPPVELILYEPFAYSEATAIAGQGGWVLNSGTSATAETGNLDVPGLASATGNRITWRAASMSLRLPLNTNIASGAIYYSFSMRVDNVGANFTAAGVLGGFTTGTTTSFGTKVDIRTNAAGGFNLGTSKPGAATLVWSTNQYQPGDTIFIVGRYVFNAAVGDDMSSLWINPNPATFGANSPPTPTLVTSGGTDLAQIDRFFYRAGGNTSTPDKLVTDELRVGFSWATVTPHDNRPALRIVRSGRDVVLSWPISAGDFVLEWSPSLSGATWATVSEPVVVDGGNKTVTIDTSTSDTAFYRLTR
jgi:hypothetical protein